MINTDKNNSFIYESKIESLSFLKDLALIFAKPAAVVYTALVLLFAFLEQGINKIVFLVPLLILSAVFLIIILMLFIMFIWEALFSPYKIFAEDGCLICKFFFKKILVINTKDILFVKRHKGHSKGRGAFYKNKYTLFLKNGKKYMINCFIFRNSSDISFFFTNITKSYNKKYIKHISDEKNTFSEIFYKDIYCFYILKNSLVILLVLCLIVLFIYFIFTRIFLAAIFTFAVLAAIPAVPVKIIMNIKEKTVILKSFCGIKIHRICFHEINRIIISNNLNISVTAMFNDKNKKQKIFLLSPYKSKYRDQIFKILHIIFKNKISFDLTGDEALISNKVKL